MSSSAGWADASMAIRFRGDEMACRSCGRLYAGSELDRYLWCPDCQRAVRRRAAIFGRMGGLIAAAGVGLYVAATVNPTNRYLLLYAGIIALTYVLVGRIVRALAIGLFRARDRAPGIEPEGNPPEV